LSAAVEQVELMVVRVLVVVVAVLEATEQAQH
jgi:hypothetical protein